MTNRHRTASAGLAPAAALAAATCAAAPALAQADHPAVAPVRSCASLAGFDLTAVGGAGSAVTSA